MISCAERKPEIISSFIVKIDSFFSISFSDYPQSLGTVVKSLMMMEKITKRMEWTKVRFDACIVNEF